MFGGRLTRLFQGGAYPLVHFFVIAGLCIIAYFIFRKLDVHPILAGIIIRMEGVIYYGLALGLFANDILWMVKSIISAVIPHSLYDIISIL